ncbi:CAP domain-containing protein [Sulfitobacter aestuariivivens]|uniref:CAP domain-containing protein n=1 Tax=Sulfitobacter aestuariivivens TaxID=2766981 RepID=UPI00361634A7
MTIASALERYLLQLVNQERAEHGLNPLTLELNLNTSADAHSRWMTNADTFSHTGVNGSSSRGRMESAGFELNGTWSTGENIGAQSVMGSDSYYDEVRLIHEGLMNSPGHRANILDPDYTHVGLGITVGPLTYGTAGSYQSVLVTQNFGNTGGRTDHDLMGTTRNDNMNMGSGDDHAILGAGHDIAQGQAGNDTIVAGSGNDSVAGGTGHDRINGNDGNDVLRGHDGNDQIAGDAGHDFLIGDGGHDTLNGGTGNDSLSGGNENDLLIGGAGFDALQGVQAMTP